MKKFYLPVVWEMEGVVEVPAETVREARDNFCKNPLLFEKIDGLDVYNENSYELSVNDLGTLKEISEHVSRTLKSRRE